jgi:hypothetical protein
MNDTVSSPKQEHLLSTLEQLSLSKNSICNRKIPSLDHMRYHDSTKFSTPQILIVAWPHGNTMMGSIRKVPEGKSPHFAPPEFSTNISLNVIPKGTFVAPSGDWQYTFVCNGCLNRTDVYPATAATENLAWALSRDPLLDPANRAGKLNHHHAGSGRFTADLSGARHEEYAEWTKMAA